MLEQFDIGLRDKTPVAFQSIDLEGRIIQVNHPWEDLTGYSADEAVGTSYFDLVPEDHTADFVHTHPRNLTPDNETGMGRFTERQIFNALRYGLRPEDTPDVEITSTTPGVGNFPLHPRYLAEPMPWMAWRHMSDEDLWAIAAYLKRGVKPVHNMVAESEGPPDFWASEYTVAKIGAYPAASFPTRNEQTP